MFHVRAITESDHENWLQLWNEYCAFYKVKIDQRISSMTWRRIICPHHPIFSLIAENEQGECVGFCNYVCHPNTWSDQTVCYLEDIYVRSSCRKLGVGSALIDKLAFTARSENWCRVYWITKADNAPARALYDRIAQQTDHVRYEISF